MRRRAKPAKAKAGARLPVAPKSRRNGAPTVRDLETRLADALKREAEALEQQTATAEILRVIASSPTELSPVFAILDKRWSWPALNSERFFATSDELSGRSRSAVPAPSSWPVTTSAAWPAVLSDERPVEAGSVPRRARDRAVSPAGSTLGQQRRARRHADAAERAPVSNAQYLGAISLYRREVWAFTEKEIALLQIFADQAVIAIENVRHRELTESLQQQTATADVLKVISRSAFDLRTVLDTLCESAVRLCDADHAYLFQRDGVVYRWAASFGHATEVHARIGDYFKGHPVPVNRGSVTGRAALEAQNCSGRRCLGGHGVYVE